MHTLAALLVAALLSAPATGSAPAAPAADKRPAQAEAPAAPQEATLKPEEAGSVEALMQSLYGFISGPAGQRRDVAKIRALFHPACIVTITGQGPEGPVLRTLTREELLARALPQWERGFYEQEVEQQVRRFGNMAQVWSRYQARLTAEGPVFLRGVNSLNLAHDGQRWWVMALQFENEPLPTAR